MSKYIIYTDGASKGNPGDAGIGVIISTQDGVPVCEIAEYIGKTTNNVAEYKALIRGLQECLELGATSVEICTDSELLERQILGIYKVKSENLKPLYSDVISMLSYFKQVNISHVLREFNKRADQLANDGVKKKHQPLQPRKSKLIIESGPVTQGELDF